MSYRLQDVNIVNGEIKVYYTERMCRVIYSETYSYHLLKKFDTGAQAAIINAVNQFIIGIRNDIY